MLEKEKVLCNVTRKGVLKQKKKTQKNFNFNIELTLQYAAL